MKNLFLVLIAVIGLSFQSNAQVDITVNPLGLLVQTYSLGVDYHFNPDWSVGGDLMVTTNSNFGIYYVNAKHYFNPLSESKKFYVGIFTGLHTYNSYDFTSNFNLERKYESTLGFGFMGGYKLISRKNVVLDVAGGIGRGIEAATFIPYFRLNAGYRFQNDKKTTEETKPIFK